MPSALFGPRLTGIGSRLDGQCRALHAGHRPIGQQVMPSCWPIASRCELKLEDGSVYSQPSPMLGDSNYLLGHGACAGGK